MNYGLRMGELSKVYDYDFGSKCVWMYDGSGGSGIKIRRPPCKTVGKDLGGRMKQ